MKAVKQLFCIALSAWVLCCTTTTLSARENNWTETKSIQNHFKQVSTQPDIEVFSAPNEIIVKVNHDVEIRVFTILGKLISSEKLTPGLFHYQVDAHGIYIIKTENTSCKVAI